MSINKREIQRRKREWATRERQQNAIVALWDASEYQDINADGTLRIVICGTQEYNGSMAKHESVQGILKYNKVKLQWYEWDEITGGQHYKINDKVVYSHLVSDHVIDDASLIITLSVDVLKLGYLERYDLESCGLEHPHFNVLPYGDMEVAS